MHPFTVRLHDPTRRTRFGVRPAAFVTALLCTATFACGGGGTDPLDPNNGNGGGSPPPPPPPVNTTSVNVVDSAFEPPAISVAPGATVTWTWTGSDAHNVTWASGGLSNSSTRTTGTFQVTMPQQTGDLVYYCTLHGTPTSGMRGTVRVE